MFRLFKKIIFIFFLVLLGFYAYSQKEVLNDSLIIHAIQQNDTEYLKNFINEYGIDQTILNGTQTLLSYSIIHDNVLVVSFLINSGTDLNLITNNMSPLMLCAVNDKAEFANLLIRNGATVDLYNSYRNTALLYASSYGSIKTIKVLASKRANPFFQNFTGLNSLDYAITYNKKEAADVLKNYMERYARGAFPSTFDGPYVEWLSPHKIKAFYMINDSLQGKIFTKSKKIKVKDSVIFNGFCCNDEFNYKIINNSKLINDNFYFSNIGKVFAIGDVHGEYDSLKTLLVNNKIINDSLNWTFGDGHLVFIGDLLDRGDKVTETLWLVYRLWQQAPQSNGMVHLLLGNHEILMFNKDYRYLNEKYVYLTRGLGLEYSNLFSQFSVLGDFIRSFKTAVQIDSVLFVHAGISKHIVDKGITIKQLNKASTILLKGNNGEAITEKDVSVITELLSDKGPLWYRGYLAESNVIPRASQQDIDFVLSFVGCKKMVIGHTEIYKIKPLYDDKLIPINVPFGRLGIRKQALMIINNHFFRCYSNGDRDFLM